MKKNFIIYCSGGASRVLKFYSNNQNLKLFKPQKVIYDGNNKETLNSLKIIFSDNLVIIDIESFSENEKKRINTTISNTILREMLENNTDYLLCFGNKILKKDLVVKFHKKIINFHPSLLPAFKGLNAIDMALSKNVSLIGNTAHFIDEKIDNGEIILQTAMLVEDYENYEHVLELQFPMIKMILRDILNFKITDNMVLAELSKRNKHYLIPKKCN